MKIQKHHWSAKFQEMIWMEEGHKPPPTGQSRLPLGWHSMDDSTGHTARRRSASLPLLSHNCHNSSTCPVSGWTGLWRYRGRWSTSGRRPCFPGPYCFLPDDKQQLCWLNVQDACYRCSHTDTCNPEYSYSGVSLKQASQQHKYLYNTISNVLSNINIHHSVVWMHVK